jgi:hypothetical protein
VGSSDVSETNAVAAYSVGTSHLDLQDGTEANSAENRSEDGCCCVTVHVTGTCISTRPVLFSCFLIQLSCSPVSGSLEKCGSAVDS